MRKVAYVLVAGLAIFVSGCSKKMPIALPSSSANSGAVTDSGLSGDVIPSNAINAGSLDSKKSFKNGAVSANGKYLGSDGVSKSGYKMLYFASDAYTLDDDQIKRLMSDIPKLKAWTATKKVLVEGNCDEFGTDEYNHALGLKRAQAVKSLLISAGIPSNKIDTVSYGESNPTCTVDKPACHAKNRRVEINHL